LSSLARRAWRGLRQAWAMTSAGMQIVPPRRRASSSRACMATALPGWSRARSAPVSSVSPAVAVALTPPACRRPLADQSVPHGRARPRPVAGPPEAPGSLPARRDRRSGTEHRTGVIVHVRDVGGTAGGVEGELLRRSGLGRGRRTADLHPRCRSSAAMSPRPSAAGAIGRARAFVPDRLGRLSYIAVPAEE